MKMMVSPSLYFCNEICIHVIDNNWKREKKTKRSNKKNNDALEIGVENKL